MKRNIYLTGELGEKFGEKFSINCSSYSEALKCINANRLGFFEYLIECDNKGVAFNVEAAGKPLDSEEELFLPLNEGDISISPIPMGAKSAGAKILGAVLIAAAIIINPSNIFLTGGTLFSGGTLTTVGLVSASIAINLALTGIQQLMAPDPATDKESPQSYLFNGSQQSIIEGDPVPVLYGELRVPGSPISFDILNRAFTKNNVRLDAVGNLILET